MESEEKRQRKISYSAILSLILGLAGIITFGLSAVLGLVLGIFAWWSIRRSGGRLSGQGFALAGIAVSCIIVVLVGGVTISFVSKKEEARLNAAKADVKNYTTALDLFELDNGLYPTGEQGLQALSTQPTSQPLAVNWKGPYLFKTRIPSDPWGKPYIYKCPGTRNPDSFDLYSAGPNGIYGDDDDVILTR
jgi:general secretion pathway protein G